MKDKHLQIPQDNVLLKLIHKTVEENLTVNLAKFRLKLSLKFVFYIILVGATYSLVLLTPDKSTFIGTYILYGLSALLLAFNFAHDLSHNTVFRNHKLNNAGFTMIYTLVGAHAASWKHRHIHSHHYAPNVEDYDSDLKITNLIRVIPGSQLKWYHRFQHLYAPLMYTTYSLFWVFIKDFVLLFTDQPIQKQSPGYVFSFFIQKLVYLMITVIIPILFSHQEWPIVVIGFLLMHIFQSLFLLFTFFMTHHVESTVYPTTDSVGVINSSWVMNQIRSSNDMHPFSEVANFIFGGFNNHIAHHLFPNKHHLYYPKLNQILYRVLEEHHIKPNQTTYWGGVVSHLKLLKKMSHS